MTAFPPDGLSLLGPGRDRRPRTVLLTGDAGYLSGRLATRAEGRGDRVVALDPAAPPAAAAAGLRTAAGGLDVVLHVAEGPRPDSARRRSGATMATLQALRTAREGGARLVLASLPGNGSHLHTDEALTTGYRSSHGVDAVLARVAVCYGPGMPDRGSVVGRMLHQARTSGRIDVGERDHEQHRLCFVDDVVEGLLTLADGDDEGPVYLGPHRDLSTAELAREVARATGTAFRVVPGSVDRPGRTERPRGSHACSGSHPRGWSPSTTLAEGLRRCVSDDDAALATDLAADVDLRGQTARAPGGV